MNVGKRLIAGLITGLGLAVVAVTFGASSASAAYPPGTVPVVTASASTVAQGGALTLSGSHFSGTVTFIGHSAPVFLGTTQASGPNGTFSLTVTIKASEFPAGGHYIEATDASGDRATFNFTVAPASAAGGGNGSGGGNGNGNGAGAGSNAGGDGNTGGSGSGSTGGGLASTGVAVLSIGGFGTLLLIGGGIMLMAGKRRKTTV